MNSKQQKNLSRNLSLKQQQINPNTSLSEKTAVYLSKKQQYIYQKKQKINQKK